MAINPNTKYPGRVQAPDADYPYGSSKNETTPGAGDGTPYEKARADDIFGFQQAILNEAGIVPSGNAETINDSDYLDGLKTLLKTGRKNKLIGNFFINQRAVSGSVVLAVGVYGHDRFKAGAGGCTYTFAIVNGVTTITITAGTLLQIIEAKDIEAGDYILSWQGTAQGQIDGGGFGDSGLVTDTLDGSANVTVEFNTGTLSLPQLELGTYSTVFERRSIGEEQELCDRFAIELGGDASYPIGNVQADDTVSGFGVIPLRSKMRAFPSLTIGAASQFTIFGENGTQSPSALILSAVSENAIEFKVTGVFVQGSSYFMRTNAVTSFLLEAEL